MEQYAQIIDKAAAMQRIGEDEDLYQEILAIFLSDYPEQVQNLKSAIASGDVTTSHRVSHSMKSAAGNIGAVSVSSVAREMENAAREGNMKLVEQLFASLENELERVQQYLLRLSN